MATELYEVLSLGMRYWFVLLGVLIVLRTFMWLWGDHRKRHRRLQGLPDAGLVGELVVIEGNEDMPAETSLPLPYEGTLGFVRSCDVVIPCEGVGRQHLDFSFQPHTGILVYPRRGQSCVVDGVEMHARSKAKLSPLHHGSILQIGGIKLKVRLFAGLEGGGRSHFQEDVPAASVEENQEELLLRSPAVPEQAYPWRYIPPQPGAVPEEEETPS